MQQELHPLLATQEKAQDNAYRCNHFICSKILERVLSYVHKTPALDHLETTDRIDIKNKLFQVYKNYCFQAEIRIIIERDKAAREGRYFSYTREVNFKLHNKDLDDQFQESFLAEVSKVIEERNQSIIEKELKRIEQLKKKNQGMKDRIKENNKLIDIYSEENTKLKAEKELSKEQELKARLQLEAAKLSSLL